MTYGNCLAGALVLYYRGGGRIVLVRQPGTWVPHFGVVRGRALFHYKLVRAVLPRPCRLLVFRGRFTHRPWPA